MSGNPFVGTARVGWMEFWTHLKSPRLLILAVLFALLIFGVSYGMSQTTNPFQSQTSVYVHPAIRNESGADHYLIVGWLADSAGTPRPGITLSLYRTNYSMNFTGPPYEVPTRTLLGQAATNDSGFVSFDVGTVMPENASFDLQGPSDLYGVLGTTGFSPGLLNQTFTLIVGGYSYSGPYGSRSVEYTHTLTVEGSPATAANISLNGTFVGHPNPFGYFSVDLPAGESFLNVSYNGYEESYPVYGYGTTGPAYLNGADVVLLTLSAGFLPLILPIVAIAASFDAVVRERAQGSLELLLCRRVRREGILAGKFLGALASIAVPVVAVLLAGAGLIAVVSGRTPTTSFVAAVILSSLFLVSVYILLMLLFSSLAKSVGTAVVFGVVLWLFFDVVFSFISIFLLFSTGFNPSNPAYYNSLATLYILDPNLVFETLVSLAFPASGGGSGTIGFLPSGYFSVAAFVAAAVVWIVVPLLVTMIVFRRKAEG